jgi:histidyl-tRNA synthetase
MKILSQLWKAGIKAETLPRADPKMKPQLNAANASSIPFALIFGKQELDAGTLQLKFLQLTEAEGTCA